MFRTLRLDVPDAAVLRRCATLLQDPEQTQRHIGGRWVAPLDVKSMVASACCRANSHAESSDRRHNPGVIELRGVQLVRAAR